MIYGLKSVLRYLTGTDIAGRSLAVFPDDTFIVSYPRSGNTWTRFLIANLLHPEEPATFANIERLLPDSEAQSSRYLRRVQRPRVIKSHQYFDPRFPRVVYILRDPRDIALSYYDFQRKYRQIEDGYPLASYVSDFVNGRLISRTWGTWGENVGSWLAARGGSSRFLALRYEDMIADTAAQLKRIAGFLEVDLSAARLASVIELSSADRMRELEKTQGKEWVSTKNKRSDIPFVRSAVSGGWKTKLPEASVAEIEAAWGSLMQSVGYTLATQPPSSAPGETERLDLSSVLQAAIPGPPR
jgi:Sulfotransferase domain